MGSPSLQSLRILDLGQVQSAFCGRLLADLGADVVKVEPPSGDPGRRKPPFKDDRSGPTVSLWFAHYNAGKRSVTLDLETRDGQALLRALVPSADVVLESFQPGYLEGLGLGVQALQALRPELVVTSVTAFGQTGPKRNFVASELTAFASGGVMYISGDPARPPVTGPWQQAYDIASLHAASYTLMALWARRRTGRGQHVDTSMQETLATEEHTIARFTHEGVVIRREGSQHEAVAPGNIYPCRDGYVHLFVANASPGAWDRFLTWIGDPPELRDPRWEEATYRRRNWAEMTPFITAFTMQHGPYELMEQGQARHIPCIALNTPGEFMRNPQARARGTFLSVDDRTLGRVDVIRPPFRFSDSTTLDGRSAPLLGEHNLDLYCGELGLEASEVEALYEAGVI